jgi:hypothetical protein
MSETISAFLEEHVQSWPPDCSGMERFQGVAQRPNPEFSTATNLLERSRAAFDGASSKAG